MTLVSAFLFLGLQTAPSWTASADVTAGGARIELQSPNEDFYISVGAFGRYSWPFGTLEDHDIIISGNVVIIPDHLNYSNLFDAGGGFALEASVMFVRPPPPQKGAYGQALPRDPTAGLYVSFQSDSYEGDSTTDGNAFIDPDDLNLTAVLVGLKVTTDLGGGLIGEAHLGAGLVRYEAVDARVSLNGGGESTQELFEDSQEFAGEFRYRFSARLGPVGLVAGLGLRIMGGPDEGDSEVGDLLDTHAFWSFDFDVGVEIGF